MPNSSPCILIMAGGTGGHIFPGLAVANELREKSWNIHWLGTQARMEAQIVPNAGYPIHFIDVAGVRGNGLFRLLAAPFKLLKAMMQARKVIKEHKPDVVLGMGGFASGPGGIAAWLSGTPLIVHEQNAVAGMTNKWLSRIARSVFTGFENTSGLSNAVWIGNPVRSDIASLSAAEQPNAPMRVLVVGGSLGAKTLNENVPKSLTELETLEIKHQCGKGNKADVEKAYSAVSNAQVEVSDFIEDMAAAYQWADLIICRAGALTVAEVAAAGKAAVFVPLPHAVDDHQTKNAKSLADHQAAELMPQPELERGELNQVLRRIQQYPLSLIEMGQRAKALHKPYAAAHLAAECESMIGAAA